MVAELEFVIDSGKFFSLCKLRGWKYPSTDLAKVTGYSRSYCVRILAQQEELTARFMLKYAAIAGVDINNISEWAALFKIKTKAENPNHQKDNMEKYNGHKPYTKYSLAAIHARIDRPDVEEEEEIRNDPTIKF